MAAQANGTATAKRILSAPDLINVFRTAGHLLGLVSCGLTRGKVALSIDVNRTKVQFDWAHWIEDINEHAHQGYVVRFSELDNMLEPELKFHATRMLDQWNNFTMGVSK